MLLALDISTSIIGWSIWEDDKPIKAGYFKLANSKNEPKELADRLDVALEKFSSFEGITKIAAEAALQKFTKGKSTINTLNKLIAMNFGLTYTLSRKWNVPVEYIDVKIARKKAGITVPKQPKYQKKDDAWAKKIVTEAVSKQYPTIYPWTPKYGVYKSDFDVADSIVIGKAARKK